MSALVASTSNFGKILDICQLPVLSLQKQHVTCLLNFSRRTGRAAAAAPVAQSPKHLHQIVGKSTRVLRSPGNMPKTTQVTMADMTTGYEQKGMSESVIMMMMMMMMMLMMMIAVMVVVVLARNWMIMLMLMLGCVTPRY
ncbi:hypothetical protein AK812_SmicGene15257 [Symbiodinium microadriaticum]|uniref:Uncharacterized protein n=1 Tax=Symbiodinium microadriaticum TaxID=2951 RepID=A0A1Q9E3I5_SYMMI|nr:hypothetical protein AK812_SmicGene15257 [Symbiodinium microadriaticum]